MDYVAQLSAPEPAIDDLEQSSLYRGDFAKVWRLLNRSRNYLHGVIEKVKQKKHVFHFANVAPEARAQTGHACG